MKKLFVLASNSLRWHMFAIDDEQPECYYICIDKNDIVAQLVLTIDQARGEWRRIRQSGFSPKTEREVTAGVLTSHFTQRYNEFCRWKNGRLAVPFQGGITEYDNPEHLRRLEIAIMSEDWVDWADYQVWVEEQGNIGAAFNNYEPETIISTDALEESSLSRTNEIGGDADNYWNQEGVFEEATDMDAQED